ncbi:MAG: hypothetical protein RL220_863 [Bacteroidota bacterium]
MQPFRKVAFHTLGCKLNFSETSTLARQFLDAGFARVDEDERPDVFVLNTCSVTEEADKKCRNLIRRVKSRNPDTYVAVVGCYAQLKPDAIASIPGVNLVLGAGEKFNLVSHIEQTIEERTPRIAVGQIRDVKEFIPSFSRGDRTRTFLKVQDGCNYFCAFCTIPLARGRSRSATIAETVQEALKAEQAGAREIVLTGVNIGDFGVAHGESFLELIRQLDQLSNIERFRISSIEPNLLSDEIIDFVASSGKFMPHFHIPLQSGSDKILAAMRRRYRTDLYRRKTEEILKRMPDACIGIDVITGFPGEDEIAFSETHEFLAEIPAAYFHVFTYSERENTTALRLSDVVPMNVRHERTKILRLMSEKKRRAFNSRFTGSDRPVLWEAERDGDMMSGYTDNYIRVHAPYDETMVNRISSVRLTSINADGDLVASSDSAGINR